MKIEFIQEPKAGDIAFSYPIELGFYSRGVRWFTKSLWSHSFHLSIDYLGEKMVFETDLKAQLVPFKKEYIEKQADAYEVWRPIKAKAPEILEATKHSYFTIAGETYGFLSIPWFAVREVIYWLTGKKLWKNFKTEGAICSESLIVYIKALGGEYAEAFKHLTRDETSPEDIYRVVKNRSDLFQFIGKRE